jgi:phospholipid/cholesterol/gamma-HCH transport system ATP-binding protein
VSFSDFLAPTFRTCAFGLIIGLVACFQGMRTQGRHRGRGAFGDEFRCLVFPVRDFGGRHSGKVDSYFFPMKHSIAESIWRAISRGQRPGEPVLVLRDVHKSFGAQHVLDGISLTVGRGKTLAVLGRSGTGKSVLLKLIIGLENRIPVPFRIQGQEIEGLALNEMNRLRIKMGFLFQNAALYDSLTVEQNVAFPLERHTKMTASERSDRVKELLSSVGMEQHLNKMPSDISGGMQKRVGLARALALQPEILLLDEPTAGLDPITSGEIDDLVLKLQKEHALTSIVVTHDLQSAKTIADRWRCWTREKW